jgi:cell division protein FtsB
MNENDVETTLADMTMDELIVIALRWATECEALRRENVALKQRIADLEQEEQSA